jgi:glycosyltransferase involved in cell wall biosynthesis
MNTLALRQKNRALDRILAVSNAVARANLLDRQPVPFEVVPNFIPDDLGENPPGRPDWLPQGPYLLYVGDLSDDKGVHVLLQGYRLLAEPRPPLLFIGRSTPTTPTASALPEGVQMFGPRAHEDVASAMAHAAVVVVPSIVPDSCPTVILEAMAFGTPVVTTATGGIVDMVTDGREGRVVQPGDEAALAGALDGILGSEEERCAAGKAARKRADAFRAGPVVDRIEHAYRLAVHHRAQGSGHGSGSSTFRDGEG